MLQVDHVYEFFYNNIFNEFDFLHCYGGVINTNQITINDIAVFTPGLHTTKKIFFYDQEPLLDHLTDNYLDVFNYPSGYTINELLKFITKDSPIDVPHGYPKQTANEIQLLSENINRIYKKKTIVTSEKSPLVDSYTIKYDAVRKSINDRQILVGGEKATSSGLIL